MEGKTPLEAYARSIDKAKMMLGSLTVRGRLKAAEINGVGQ
jgi:hypothetical protein